MQFNNSIFIGSNINQELEDNDIEIHIKVQQRNGKKCWTLIEGIEQIRDKNISVDIFLKNVLTDLKDKFNCGGSIMKKTNNANITSIQLNGDHREELKEYIIKKYDLKAHQLKVHGF